MDMKFSISPFELKTLSTAEMRDRILIEKVFEPNCAKLTYSFDERFILGGIMPFDKAVTLEPDDTIRQEFFLKTRELGMINIGGPGKVSADGETFAIGFEDGMYIGCGTKDVVFTSDDPANPAKFYITSLLAFCKHPTCRIAREDAQINPCGLVVEMVDPPQHIPVTEPREPVLLQHVALRPVVAAANTVIFLFFGVVEHVDIEIPHKAGRAAVVQFALSRLSHVVSASLSPISASMPSVNIGENAYPSRMNPRAPGCAVTLSFVWIGGTSALAFNAPSSDASRH